MSLGPGIPERPEPFWQSNPNRHKLPDGYGVQSTAVLGGLHHEYRLKQYAALTFCAAPRNRTADARPGFVRGYPIRYKGLTLPCPRLAFAVLSERLQKLSLDNTLGGLEPEHPGRNFPPPGVKG